MNPPALLATAIEKGFNTLLSLDERVQPRLLRMEGKLIGLQIEGLDLRLNFFIADGKVQLLKEFSGEPQALISGPPLSLLSLKTQAGRPLFKGEVSISGDVELGKSFKRLFDSLDIDWEEHLSFLVGDLLAHQIGNGFRSLTAWGKRSSESLVADIGDYLREESRQLPSRYEVDDFLAGVDQLRSDLDRLQARVDRLLQQNGKAS